MENIKVTVAQFIPKLGEPDINVQNIKKAIVEAKEEGSDLIVFPELYLTGYSVGNNMEKMAETVDGTYMLQIRKLCKTNKINLVICFPEVDEHKTYYISSAFIDDQGEVLGVYRKVHLFDTEKHHFTPGDSFEVIDTPLGKVGMMICFDVEFPEIARALKLLGADFIVIVNANMEPYEELHHIFARARAMENEIPVIICNRLGTEGSLNFCGDSMVIDAAGEILLSLKQQEKMQTVELPIKQQLDPKMSYTTNRRKDLYGILTK